MLLLVRLVKSLCWENGCARRLIEIVAVPIKGIHGHASQRNTSAQAYKQFCREFSLTCRCSSQA